MIRQPRLRWARQEAEGPDRDPLLDATRILAVAQRIAAEQVNGPAVDPLEAHQTSEAN